VLFRLADALPADIKVCIVADRGFGDQKLYRVLTEDLKFDYVIRFRGNIAVTTVDGEVRTAAAWVGPGGRARILRDAMVTAERYRVGTVLCVQDKAMKQAWCLATSSTVATARALMTLYGKRWGIDIDQTWRLSRLSGYTKLRRFGRGGDRRRQAAPRWGRSANRSERRDRRLIGVQQSELTSPDPNRAAG
jgi:Transposase DDE domain